MFPKICFDAVEILDWYDGPVLAVGTFHNTPFLVLLVACKNAGSRRISAVMVIDGVVAESLTRPRERTDDAWTDFVEDLHSCLLNNEKGAYLTTEPFIHAGECFDVHFDPAFDPAAFVPHDTGSAWDDKKFDVWDHRLAALIHGI